MKNHEELVLEAEKAINELFSDLSVSRSETLADLQALSDTIGMFMETLKD